MIARHGKFSTFFLDGKVVETAFLRKLIAQSYSIVIDTETDVHITVGGILLQLYQHIIIMIADRLVLSPNRSPSLIESGSFLIDDAKIGKQVLAILTTLGELITQTARLDNGLALIGHTIGRHSAIQGEVHLDLSVRRSDVSSICRDAKSQQKACEQKKFFHVFLFKIVCCHKSTAKINKLVRIVGFW